MTATAVTGRCACGAITYRIGGPLREVWNCHCPRCRRITGHYLAATRARRDDLRIETGAERLTWWEPDDTAAYGFCRDCGSTLFWRSASHPHSLAVAAGPLDPPTGLRTTRAWWTAEASDYHQHQAGLELIPHEDGPAAPEPAG